MHASFSSLWFCFPKGMGGEVCISVNVPIVRERFLFSNLFLYFCSCK